MVIDQHGEKLGVMMRREALELAKEAELDLFIVAPNAQVPVAKILDYGKYRFEQQKKSKEAKKKQHVTEIKPLRLSPVIDVHDFQTKLNQSRKWLSSGKKVKIDMRFRGRLNTRVEVGLETMNKFIEQTSDLSDVESKPKKEGNIMSCVLAPKKNLNKGEKENAKDEN